MTVINNPARNQYVAIAAQTIFAYGFEISDEDNIQVYQRAGNAAPDDVADLLTIGVDYTVTGVGVNTGGTIILTSGATVGDIITLQGNAPPVRSTSFTPGGVIQASNLNTEFDDEILIYQTILGVQNYLVPKYAKSAIVQAFDLVLPVLEAETTWVMNAAGDEIVTASFPADGAPSKLDTFVTITDETADAPNSFPLSAIGSALMVNVVGSSSIITRTLTGTANQIDVNDGDGQAGNPTISISNNPILGGTAGMGIPAGTTAQRVVPAPPNIGLRFNTTLASLEFYTGGTWVQIEDSTDIATLLALLASHAAGEGASLIGLEGVASTVQDFVEGAFVVDAADPLYPNGIAIADYVGTLLQGHSTVLDDVASGALRPGTGAAATMVLQAYDVDGAAYVTFGTLTSNNTPTFDLNPATTYGGSLLLPLTGGTMTGTLLLDGTQTASNAAATVGFVTSIVQNVHPACYAATTANLATYTYTNGSSGVGARLTNSVNGAFSTDGVSPPLNSRILVPNQTSQLENGIYTVLQVGDGGSGTILERATDYDQGSEMQAGDRVDILFGSTLAGHQFIMTQTAAITVGVTAITWSDITYPGILPVASGGTGVGTFTAYAPIFGGTTATGALQSGALGNAGQVLTSNGSGAIATFQDPAVGNIQVVTQVFTSSGTYTPTTGMVACIAEAVGGGGGGGGVANCAAANFRLAAGGGYGGYGRKTYTAAEIGADAAVTIGALGAGGANTGANGGTGGNTTFNPAGTGATLTANGGAGGTYDTIDRTTLGWGGGESPGAGGTASNGDINIQGQYGQLTIVVGLTNIVNLITGIGGSGIYGAGGRQNVDGTRDGRGGTGYGAGGSGAATVNAAGAGTGGDGTAGIVIVTEFVIP